jgi:hypothetical protein
MRNGVTLQISDCNDETSQQWTGAGAYQWSSNKDKDSTKCIDLFGADTTNGTRIEIWDCVALPSPHFSQQWLGPNSEPDDGDLKSYDTAFDSNTAANVSSSKTGF